MVAFTESFSAASYKLFELDEAVLQELAQPGGRLRIKGAAEDEAVLCASDNTHELRLAESSNNMLLLPKPLRDGDAQKTAEAAAPVVVASVMSHFELKPTAPRTSTLRKLLAARPWSVAASPEEDGSADVKGDDAGRLSLQQL